MPVYAKAFLQNLFSYALRKFDYTKDEDEISIS